MELEGVELEEGDKKDALGSGILSSQSLALPSSLSHIKKSQGEDESNVLPKHYCYDNEYSPSYTYKKKTNIDLLIRKSIVLLSKTTAAHKLGGDVESHADRTQCTWDWTKMRVFGIG